MIRAIIAGLGGRGRYWYQQCSAHPEVEIVACVEPLAANRESAMAEFDIDKGIFFFDLREAAKEVAAEFVVDITPPAIHEGIANTAFEAGLHLLGEKPISDDYEAAQRMVAAGKQAGVIHMVTQNYRFNGLPRSTRRLLEEGRIGDVAQLDVSLYVDWADNPGSHYVREPYMFLTDMGIHHFDMMRYTLNKDPVSAFAVTWNLPWGWHEGDACQIVIFRFADGAIATHRGIGCTMGHVPAGHNGEWRYEGPKGTLTWEGFQLFYSKKHKTDPPIREEIALDDTTVEGGNPILHEFLLAVRGDRTPECNAEDNLKSVAMVFAAVKSAREGREVFLNEL